MSPHNLFSRDWYYAGDASIPPPPPPPPPDPTDSGTMRTPKGWSDEMRQATGFNVHWHYSGIYVDRQPELIAKANAFNPGVIRCDLIQGISGTARTNQRNGVAGTSGASGGRTKAGFIIGQGSLYSSADITNALAEVKSRYGGETGNANGYVGWMENVNEPDPTTNWQVANKQYQTDIKTAFKGDPATDGIPLASSALAYRGNIAQYDDLGDISSLVDWGNGHWYTGGQMPEFGFGYGTINGASGVPYLVGLATDGKPTMITECGGHNLQYAKKFTKNADGSYTITGNDGHNWTPEDVMGIYGFRYVLAPVYAGMIAAMMYEFVDQADPTSYIATINKEKHFGLLRWDLSEKPIYKSLANAIAVYNDAGSTAGKSLTPMGLDFVNAPSDFRWLLHQRTDGAYILAVWRQVSVFAAGYAAPDTIINVTPKVVTLQFGKARNVTLYRPSNQAGPIAGGGNGLTSCDVTLTGDPWLVKIV